MQDFLIMGVLNRQTNLSEPIQYLILTEVLVFACFLILFLLLLFNLRLQIAIIGIVHHNAQFATFCLVDFSEASDVRMI